MDTLKNINQENLRTNVAMAACILYGLMHTENLPTVLSVFRDKENFMYYRGVTAVYDPTIDWWVGKKALVFYWAENWPRPSVTFTDENGVFNFASSSFSDSNFQYWTRIIAFVVNNHTGNIEYASTEGKHQWSNLFLYGGGEGRYFPVTTRETPWDIGFLSLFKCSTAVIFNVIYPYEPGRVEVRVLPLRWDAKISPEDYYSRTYRTYSSRYGSVGVVFIPPETPIGFLLKSFEEYPVGVLANITEDNPEGWGYTFEAGQQVMFSQPKAKYAYEMFLLSTKYTSPLEALHITGIEEILEQKEKAQMFMEKAEEALSNVSYTDFFQYNLDAWVAARNVYISARTKKVEIINTLPFFAFLLVPFVFLFERLVFHVENAKKRIFLLIVIFSVFDAFLSYLQPGFRLASNPLMVVIASVVFIMIMPALYMIFSYLVKSLRKVKIEMLGIHEIEVTRASAALLSFQTGLENMRRRRFRSSLMLFTIILVVMGVTLFSSLSSISVLRVTSGVAETPYDGILIYNPNLNPLSFDEITYLKARCKDEADVSVTSWVYTSNPSDDTGKVLFRVTHGESEYKIYAFMGMDSTEPFWLPAVDFKGRWFMKDEIYSIIVPDSMLEELGVSIGDIVHVLDKDLTIIGSFDSLSLDSIRDLYGEGITPVDYRLPDELPHIQSADIAIIPYELSLLWKPQIMAVNIIPRNTSMVKPLSTSILKTLKQVNLVAGVNNEIIFYSLATSVTLFGWQMQIVPLALAALMVFNLVLGGVKEREKEIFTYSSIGLSPSHIMFMFLAESVIYAVVGGVLGYTCSIAAYTITSATALLAFTINYSSSFVALTLICIMIVTILSSIYPAILASKIVTPSLERAWKIKTKPVGDLWEIPIPTIITDRDVLGISNYLEEFIRVGEAGLFSTENYKIRKESNLVEIEMTARLTPYE
ncbi:MAG: hypothetical protein JRD69_10065, partial [Deltaproteobacteria bacterium]|nr:hypothetical protein [Deltaproteobacteria bacterium]